MSTHTYNTPRTQTKEFELVTRVENASLGFPARRHRTEKSTTPPAAESSLREFHEEFKSLVLAEEEARGETLSGDSYVALFEPHEIEWNDFLGGAATTSPATVLLPQPAPAAPAPPLSKSPPQQAVRPLVGPRLGTPVPIESWVVKVIAVLVGLNLLFAGLIVAGVRLSDLFK
ncbi:MAG: hypothetical protein U0Y68_14535 [Blastocatellia bacterium]